MRIYVARAIESYNDKTLLLLDSQRREKVERLKIEKERLRSISAGLLLRYVYMEENNSGKDWNGVRISTGQYGKPYIEGDETFNYSISHSGEYVLCATDSVPIGADIQELKSYKMAMAKRFFNEKEYERIENTPENDRIYEFYKIWTAKESAVKLSGRGMGEGIEHLVTNKTYNTIKNIVSKKSLNIKIYDEIEGYMVCACSNGEDFPCSLKIIGGLVC